MSKLLSFSLPVSKLMSSLSLVSLSVSNQQNCCRSYCRCQSDVVLFVGVKTPVSKLQQPFVYSVPKKWTLKFAKIAKQIPALMSSLNWILQSIVEVLKILVWVLCSHYLVLPNSPARRFLVNSLWMAGTDIWEIITVPLCILSHVISYAKQLLVWISC